MGMLLNPAMEIIDLESDASGRRGCAAIWGPHWLIGFGGVLG